MARDSDTSDTETNQSGQNGQFVIFHRNFLRNSIFLETRMIFGKLYKKQLNVLYCIMNLFLFPALSFLRYKFVL